MTEVHTVAGQPSRLRYRWLAAWTAERLTVRRGHVPDTASAVSQAVQASPLARCRDAGSGADRHGLHRLRRVSEKRSVIPKNVESETLRMSFLRHGPTRGGSQMEPSPLPEQGHG